MTGDSNRLDEIERGCERLDRDEYNQGVPNHAPWRAAPSCSGPDRWIVYQPTGSDCSRIITEGMRQPFADFIAAAREDVPWLIRELRDARVEIEMKSERAGLFRDAYRDLRSRVRTALGLPQMLASIDQKDVQLREIETAAQKLVTDLAAERAKVERVRALRTEWAQRSAEDRNHELWRALGVALTGGEQGE